jgi:hypothetical protein
MGKEPEWGTSGQLPVFSCQKKKVIITDNFSSILAAGS